MSFVKFIFTYLLNSYLSIIKMLFIQLLSWLGKITDLYILLDL